MNSNDGEETGMELVVPTTKELEALSPKALWDVAEVAGEVQDRAWELVDKQLRTWVEKEGKTQREIAKLVGRDQSRVSRRCSALGIASGSKRGGDRRSFDAGASNAPDDEAEVVEGEVVEGELFEEKEGVAQDACFIDPHEFADWGAVLKAVEKELKDLYAFAEEAPHLEKAEAMERLAAQLMRRSKKLRKELEKETR